MFRHRRVRYRAYRAYGFSLRSDVALRELSPVSRRDREPVIRIETGRLEAAEWALRYQSVWESGELFMASHGVGSRYRLHFPDSCDFDLDVKRMTVKIPTPTALSPDIVGHRLLDQAIPRLIAASGRLVLHASAVGSPLGTLAFLGSAGAGKSTLAAAFCAAGDPLVADDALVVRCVGDECWATPGYPSLRVFGETARACFPKRRSSGARGRRLKVRIRPTRWAVRETRLAHILLPVQAEVRSPRLEPVRSRSAFLALLGESYRLDAVEGCALRTDMARLAETVSRCPVSRLVLPRDLDALPAIRTWLLSELANPEVVSKGDSA